MVTATRGNTYSIDYNDPTKVVLTARNDIALANNDAFATDENSVITGAANVFANNGCGADIDLGDEFVVTAVNGTGANVGTQITLASGAKLTLNANGTFSYDPERRLRRSCPRSDRARPTSPRTTPSPILCPAATPRPSPSPSPASTTTTPCAAPPATIRSAAGIVNDTYFVENSGDAVNEIAGQGTLDRVLASVSYVLDGRRPRSRLMSTTNSLGTGAINLTGNDLANTIYGNAGDQLRSKAAAATTCCLAWPATTTSMAARATTSSTAAPARTTWPAAPATTGTSSTA